MSCSDAWHCRLATERCLDQRDVANAAWSAGAWKRPGVVVFIAVVSEACPNFVDDVFFVFCAL